jgi:hypothetical protein
MIYLLQLEGGVLGELIRLICYVGILVFVFKVTIYIYMHYEGGKLREKI